MKQLLLITAGLLCCAGCGVTEFSSPGSAPTSSVHLVREDSAALAFADSLAGLPNVAHRPGRPLRRLHTQSHH